MNHTHNTPSLPRQLLHVSYHLVGRLTVQSTGGFVKEHNLRIGHQLESDRESLPLSAGQIPGLIVGTLFQSKQGDNVVDDFGFVNSRHSRGEFKIGRVVERFLDGDVLQQGDVLGCVGHQLAIFGTFYDFVVDQDATLDAGGS